MVKNRVLLPFFCLSLALLNPMQAESEPIHRRILGGQFTTLAYGPVAYIVTDTFSCSGILVGEREVLTAAHCVQGTTENANYRVVLGGKIRTIESRYYSSAFHPEDGAFNSAPYDLGMLILSEPASEVSPVPVLFRDAVVPGEKAKIYGYGMNEESGQPDRNPLENAKVADMVVLEAAGGLFASNHTVTGASTCHGDSGGPAVQTLGGYDAVVGTLSIGVNKDADGNCELAGDGSYAYVDLQSSFSQAFLTSFSGVRFISGYRIFVHSISEDIVPQLTAATKVKSIAVLNKKLKPLLKELNIAVQYADGTRMTLVKSAIRSIKSVATERTLSKALKSVKSALRSITGVSELGVN